MAKAFSVGSWNVEHFWAIHKNKAKPEKTGRPHYRVSGKQNADVVAVYEVSWARMYTRDSIVIVH